MTTCSFRAAIRASVLLFTLVLIGALAAGLTQAQGSDRVLSLIHI